MFCRCITLNLNTIYRLHCGPVLIDFVHVVPLTVAWMYNIIRPALFYVITLPSAGWQTRHRPVRISAATCPPFKEEDTVRN